MDAAFVALVVIVAVALAFDYTNGFHDAANAIAVAVSTKALTPRVALALAAVMNLVGALISTKVAKTVGEGIIDAPQGSDGLKIVFAALIGAITWNLITWYFGLPSSSSHALIGGLVGSALAAARTTQNGTSKVSISPAVYRASVMMPIVFWASCMPWPSAIEPELTIWA